MKVKELKEILSKMNDDETVSPHIARARAQGYIVKVDDHHNSPDIYRFRDQEHFFSFNMLEDDEKEDFESEGYSSGCDEFTLCDDENGTWVYEDEVDHDYTVSDPAKSQVLDTQDEDEEEEDEDTDEE